MKFVLRERLEKLLETGKSFAGQLFPFGKYALVTDTTASKLRGVEAEKRQDQYRETYSMFQNRVSPYHSI